MKKYKYLIIFLSPFCTWISLTSVGWMSYFLLIFAFVLIPLLELALPMSESNLTAAEEEIARVDPFYDWVLYVLVPIHFYFVFLFLQLVSVPFLPTFDKIGYTISMGLACGMFGINLAHELGHRITPIEQMLSKALLMTSLYMHFFIEHNRGHHKNVSTEEDAASASKGEVVYAFWIRSMFKSFIHAWELERMRLYKDSKSILHYSNEMIWYIVIQIGFVSTIWIVWGIDTMLIYLIVAFIGILMLETVNYIEHYGLRRSQSESGIYEKVMPHHSWNSNHIVGRTLLFELSRHSDHHYLASRKFQILRHHDHSPQMPTGYPGMMIISLCPPLFFRIMHPMMDKKGI